MWDQYILECWAATDRHLLQAAGQAGGGHAVPGPLGVVHVLQRAAHAVAAGQRRAAAALLPPGRLVLQEAQRVRLHRLWDQTRGDKKPVRAAKQCLYLEVFSAFTPIRIKKRIDTFCASLAECPGSSWVVPQGTR